MAFGAAVVSTANLGDEFQKTSIRTGVAVESLSALKFASEQAGANFGSLTKGLKTLAKTSNEASTGTASYADAFKELGVTVTDNSGSLKSVEQLMLESADAFAAMGNDTKAAALAQEVFGKAGTDLLPMLKLGKAGIKELTDQAGKLGFVMSGETADASAEFNDALNELKSSMGGAVQNIGGALIPALTSIVDKVTPVISSVTKWIGENPKLVTSIAAIAAIITGAGGVLLAIGAIMLAVGPVIAILSGPVGLGIAIGAAVAALAVFASKNEAIRKVVKIVWEAIKAKVKGPLEFLKKGVGVVGGVFSALAEKLGLVDTSVTTSSQHVVDMLGEIITKAPETVQPITNVKTAHDDLATAMDDVKEAAGSVFGSVPADYLQVMSNAKTAGYEARDAYVALGSALDIVGTEMGEIPPPPDIFTQEWAKPQIRLVEGMSADAALAMVEQIKTDRKSVQAAYDETFEGVKGAFGSTFQSMVTKGKFELGTLKDYFVNTFSSIFFEEILGSLVSSFITPFVNKLKEGLLGVFTDLFGGAVGGAASGAASGGASAAAGGAATAPLARRGLRDRSLRLVGPFSAGSSVA